MLTGLVKEIEKRITKVLFLKENLLPLQPIYSRKGFI